MNTRPILYQIKLPGTEKQRLLAGFNTIASILKTICVSIVC